MKRLSAAVKKELQSFERNTRIQTEALADTSGSAGEVAGAVAKRKKSNKEDDDENAEENAEFDEGKLRFAGQIIAHSMTGFLRSTLVLTLISSSHM